MRGKRGVLTAAFAVSKKFHFLQLFFAVRGVG
jgi:hypothetical protein